MFLVARVGLAKKTGINIETEISFFLDECMKASKELADAIPLAENNGGYANNPPYYIQFADKSLEKYPEILFFGVLMRKI